MRSVRPGFQLELRNSGNNNRLLSCRCAVVGTVVTAETEFVNNPFIAVTSAGIDGASAIYFLRLLQLGASGATRIDALAVLFLGWAFQMTQLDPAERSVWPGRGAVHVIKWAKRQPWIRPDGVFGVNIHLILHAVEREESCTYATVVTTATASARTFFTRALSVRVLDLVRSAVGEIRAVSAYVAPELEILAGVTKPRLIREVSGGLAITFRKEGSGALLKWISTVGRGLLSDGFVQDPKSNHRRRDGPTVGFHLKPTAHPFLHIEVAPMLYYVYLTRALIGIGALMEGKLELELKPYASTAPDKTRSVRNLFTVNNSVMRDGEYVTWLHIYFWAIEAKITKLTLTGNTAIAIRLRNNGGVGSVWLELMRGKLATVLPDLLAVSDGATLPECRHSVTLAAILDKTGCLDPSKHCAVHSPARAWFPDDGYITHAAELYFTK